MEIAVIIPSSLLLSLVVVGGDGVKDRDNDGEVESVVGGCGSVAIGDEAGGEEVGVVATGNEDTPRGSGVI